MSFLVLYGASCRRAHYRPTLKPMPSNSQRPIVALKGLEVLKTEHKLSGIVNLGVPPLGEGTMGLEETMLKVVLYLSLGDVFHR